MDHLEIDEPLISRELSPNEVVLNFPEALRNLRFRLSKLTKNFENVKLVELARLADLWWVDSDGDLVGKGVHFTMIGPDWQPGNYEDTVMIWDAENKIWIEHQLGLNEIHLDRDVESGPYVLGGYEPIPNWDDEDEEGEPVIDASIEELRSVVRDILRGIYG